MAIPQPGFVGTRDSYRQDLTNRGNVTTQAVGNFGNLQERKRQYNITNQLSQAEKIVNNQYGGNWAEFLQGDFTGYDEAGNPEYSGNPMAENMFRTLYGRRKGSKLYEEALYATPQTREQLLERIQRDFLVSGAPSQEPPAPTAPSGEPFQGTPASFQPPQAQAQQERMRMEGFKQAIPQAAEGADRSAGPYMRSAGATQEERFSDWTGGTAGVPMEYPNTYTVEGEVQHPDYAKRVASQKMAELSAQARQTGQTMNARGLPVASGQENAALPLNSGTLPLFSGIAIERSNYPDATSFNTAIATQLKTIGNELGGEEVGAFLSQATASMIGDSPEAKEAWAKYDEDAKRLLGVDGQTAFSIRNQIFDNIQNGRPSDYMPPEDERKQWWWTGEKMPVWATAREFATLDNPTMDEAKAVVQSGQSIDFSKASSSDLVDLSAGIQKVHETLLKDSYAFKPTITGLSNQAKIPEKVVNDAMVYLNSDNPGQTDDKTKRGIDRLEASYNQTVVQAVEIARENRELGSITKRSRGEGYRLASHLHMTEERKNEIYNQLNNRDPAQMDVEIRTAIPIEERRFHEAQRQFNVQMGFTERQWEGEAGLREAREKLLQVQAMEADFKMKMIALEMEAVENNEPVPNFAVMYESNDKLITTIREDLLSKTTDVDSFMREWGKALETIPGLKEAIKNNAEIHAYQTGAEVSETSFLYGAKPNLWQRWWGSTPKGTEVGTQAQAFLGGSRLAPPNPTVTDNTGGGNTQNDGGAGSDFATRQLGF